MNKPNDRRTWELALLARATRFVVSVPSTAPRARGQRLQWDTTNFWCSKQWWPFGEPTMPYDTREEALRAACHHVRATASPERVLIYAVDDATGDQFALSKEDWT